MENALYDVHLAIYDLSRGMARSLSAQFLGPQYAIEIIPHTGIVVYGQEYFFGGGIQSEDPQSFRRNTQMMPIQVVHLGRTRVPREQFEEWCVQQMQNGRFDAAAYDLLQRNCNNFSNEAARNGLGLSQGVPDWILDVPRRFLSSPMGQLIRPMLEQMQLSRVEGAETVHTSAHSTPASQPAATRPVARTNTSTTTMTSSPQATTPAASVSVSTSNGTAKPPPDRAHKTTADVPSTPVIDSCNTYLLSNTTDILDHCVKKMIAWIEDENDKQVLTRACTALIQKQDLSSEVGADVCRILYTLLKQTSGSNTTNSKKKSQSKSLLPLMFFRVVVLHTSLDATRDCLSWIVQQLTSPESTCTETTVRSCAWVVMANALSRSSSNDAITTEHPIMSFMSSTSLMEAALADISVESQPQAQVRQAAGAFLYNFLLRDGSDHATNSKEEDGSLSDIYVSMLCVALEGLVNELDATARYRRMLILSRIIKPSKKNGHASNRVVCPEALSLIRDLEYDHALSTFPENVKGAEASSCRQLTAEIHSLLQYYDE
jgi:desumoylating isopeptidase 1